MLSTLVQDSSALAHFPALSRRNMVTRAQVINMLKDAANTIVGTLTLVLQLSMNLLETNSQPVEEEQMPPALTQQLANMCTELDRQRHLLQEVVEHQRSRSLALTELPPMTGSPVRQDPVGIDHFPEPEDDSFSVISAVPPRMPESRRQVPSQAASSNHGAPTAIAGIPLSSSARAAEAVPDNRGSRALTSSPPTLTLSQWGQKRVNWGKKHPGKTFFQVLHEDPGYLDWARPRYNSLSPEQRDFVDYAVTQLESDAEMDRRHNRLMNSPHRP